MLSQEDQATATDKVTCIENNVKFGHAVFTARRYASAVYVVIVCPSICHKSGVLRRRLNLGSRR